MRLQKKLLNGFLSLFLIGVGGCRSKKQSPSFLTPVSLPIGKQQYDEARCIDIPIPLGVRSLSRMADDADAGEVIHYQCGLPYSELIAFYDSEMEVYGWRKRGQVTAHDETVLLFEKPNKVAVVSVQHVQKKVKIFITAPDTRTNIAQFD